jgi:hypothetical protein
LLIYVTKGEEASIRQPKMLLAFLPLFATQGKQALEASKQRLPYACFFTFGDINKQA